MRFLLDESADGRLAPVLRELGHDVSVISIDHPHALPDRDVLAIAVAEQRILIAADKDFGELVFREHLHHAGVILFRLQLLSLEHKRERLLAALAEYKTAPSRYLVVADALIRP